MKNSDRDCICHNFMAAYGADALWLSHWAHDCSAVAPWIKAWALRRLTVAPALVLESERPNSHLL